MDLVQVRFPCYLKSFRIFESLQIITNNSNRNSFAMKKLFKFLKAEMLKLAQTSKMNQSACCTCKTNEPSEKLGLDKRLLQ